MQLLDSIASQEDPILMNHASKIILVAHSNAGYLNQSNARSRAGRHIFLSTDVHYPPINGPVPNIAHIIKNVMSSATEAKLAALYIVAKEYVYICLVLEEMGHPQPPTPIQTNNSTAKSVINNTIQPKRTKVMDMRFYWLRDRETLKYFCIYWRWGKLNIADYSTKHFPASHHRNVRGKLLTPQAMLEELHARIKIVEHVYGVYDSYAYN